MSPGLARRKNKTAITAAGSAAASAVPDMRPSAGLFRKRVRISRSEKRMLPTP